MFRTIYKSKIHGARVTESNLNYMGSITIDEELLEASDIVPNELVQVVNLNNGSRIETYTIPGGKGSGIIAMNGGAAKYAEIGDKLLIISYVLMDDRERASFKPKLIIVDDKNKLVDKRG